MLGTAYYLHTLKRSFFIKKPFEIFFEVTVYNLVIYTLRHICIVLIWKWETVKTELVLFWNLNFVKCIVSTQNVIFLMPVITRGSFFEWIVYEYHRRHFWAWNEVIVKSEKNLSIVRSFQQTYFSWKLKKFYHSINTLVDYSFPLFAVFWKERFY